MLNATLTLMLNDPNSRLLCLPTSFVPNRQVLKHDWSVVRGIPRTQSQSLHGFRISENSSGDMHVSRHLSTTSGTGKPHNL